MLEPPARDSGPGMIFLIPLLFAATPASGVREVGNLVFDQVPEIPATIKARAAQYASARGAAFQGFAPDGDGLLIKTRFGEATQIHHVAAPGAQRRQLTFFNEPVALAAYDPARPKDGFYFSQDTGGGEFYQLYWFDAASGKSTLITDGKSRHESIRVAHKGKLIAYSSNQRNGKDMDVWVAAHGDKPRLVKEATGAWYVKGFSADDKRLIVNHYVSINESTLHVIDVATGADTVLNEGVKASYREAAFAPTGDAVIYTSDEGAEFQRLVHHDLVTQKKTILTPALDWDVDGLAVAPSGKWIVYSVNSGGRSELYRLSSKSLAKPERLDLPVGVIEGMGFDAKGERLALSLSTSDTLSDVFVLSMATKKLERWTHSEVGGLNRAAFRTPELIKFKSFDGREIPAWFYTPAKSDRPVPVVITIHGGPEAQSRPDFSPIIQYWLNELGLAVLVPNVRGSAGYGKTYLQLDNAEKREDSVKDIGALLDWVAGQKQLDSKRVAVFGGSYGGYMVLASMTMFPERIKCGVDNVGISNFVTFLERTEAYRRDLRRVEYGDERDPKMRELLQRISPLTNAAKIKAPLFVVQGKNDPRVPVTEAEQIVATVRKQQGTVWYLLAKDEGHGFQKRTNKDAYIQATSLFWEQFLLQ